MAVPLKDLFGPDVVALVADRVGSVYPDFDRSLPSFSMANCEHQGPYETEDYEAPEVHGSGRRRGSCRLPWRRSACGHELGHGYRGAKSLARLARAAALSGGPGRRSRVPVREHLGGGPAVGWGLGCC